MISAKRGIRRKRILKLAPAQLIVTVFIAIIAVGTVLLCLPAATRDGRSAGLLDAIFTATSATCVTGLVVVDTYNYWSGFGQAVILMLVQVGGLGFMTMATLFSLIVRRSISFSERVIMMQSMNLNGMSGIVRITKNIIYGTLLFEGIGAIILAIRFSESFGFWGGLYRGVFHSVSAFCNAGFDLMGGFSSFTQYTNDITINLVLMILIIVGGLGFFVWDDILAARSYKKLSVYSKAVLWISGLLIAGGALFIAIFEWGNPETLGALDTRGKILGALFQSVSSRTAGFATIDQAALTSPSMMVTSMLMYIGGSSGSTAGGIKTVTFGLIVLAVAAVSQGRREVTLFDRRISNDNVLRAVAIAVMAIIAVITSILLLAAAEKLPLMEIIFECFSAFGTVGLSTGITPGLGAFSKIILIFLMFIGRVGIITATFAIAYRLSKNRNVISHAEGKVLIG